MSGMETLYMLEVGTPPREEMGDATAAESLEMPPVQPAVQAKAGESEASAAALKGGHVGA